MSEPLRQAGLALRLAVASLWKRRSQFLLVYLTLVISFWASFQIIAVISSVQRQIETDLERIGQDVINVHASPDPALFLWHRLSLMDCERFCELVSGVSAPVNLMPSVARNPGGEARDNVVLLIGTTASWSDVFALELVAGRFFTAEERDACVLDEWVFRRIFPGQPAEFLKTHRLIELEVAGKKESFRVVGVIRDPFKIRERLEEWDVTALARSHTVRFMEYKNIYVPREALGAGRGILGAVVRVGEGVDPVLGAERITKYLKGKGSTAVAWARKWWASAILDATSAAAALSNFIWLVVLTVTAFMVVTVILLVVRERYREIAIRRVEGARRNQVALQLVVENLVLSLFASAVGFPLALLTGRWLEVHLLGWPVLLATGDVLLVSLTGALIIGLATALPARRASSVDPVSVLSKYG